jgi:hypothetical protein
VQIRSHAQKYIIKLCKKYSIKLNKKKFKNKKSVHLEWNEKDENQKKLDINKMNKYDRNILKMFSYYDRDYSTANSGSTALVMGEDLNYPGEEHEHIQALEKLEKIYNFEKMIKSYNHQNFEDGEEQENLENLENNDNLENPSAPSSTTAEENIFSQNNKKINLNNSQSKFVKFNVLRKKLMKEDFTCSPCINKLANNTFLYKNKIFKTFSDLDSMKNNYTFTSETFSDKGHNICKKNENINLMGSVTCSPENLDKKPRNLCRKRILNEVSGTKPHLDPYPQNANTFSAGTDSFHVKDSTLINTGLHSAAHTPKFSKGLFDILNSNRNFEKKLFTTEQDSDLSKLYNLFSLLFDKNSSYMDKKLLTSFKSGCLNGINYLSKMDQNLNQLYINYHLNIRKEYEESIKRQSKNLLSMVYKNIEINFNNNVNSAK